LDYFLIILFSAIHFLFPAQALKVEQPVPEVSEEPVEKNSLLCFAKLFWSLLWLTLKLDVQSH